MDLQLNNTYLKVRVVYSTMVKYTPRQEVIKKAFWPWDKDETEEKPSWTLEIDYLSENDLRYSYTSKSDDHSVLQTQFNDVMRQIKDQDSQFADKLLEDAIINGGSK